MLAEYCPQQTIIIINASYITYTLEHIDSIVPLVTRVLCMHISAHSHHTLYVVYSIHTIPHTTLHPPPPTTILHISTNKYKDIRISKKGY